jgi:hypothetical protein
MAHLLIIFEQNGGGSATDRVCSRISWVRPFRFHLNRQNKFSRIGAAKDQPPTANACGHLALQSANSL